ncbi:germin-like protein subfamily 1 member 13 [Punica granatum]|uniref:Germin-like protein n=1 Tax=Punica granatum TaxID=22663 RepID=A0A6P8C4D3_PUNGR|nr:germin-like protein subfamily 1 member 13 [Punica granatum]
MKLFVALLVCALAISSSFAFDPKLPSFYTVFINGKLCKNPNLTVADDFLFREINIPLDTNNNAGSIVTMVAIDQLPGLNTLGISLARIDYAPYGLNPRATEVIMCVQGELQVGFVLSNQLGNRLVTQILKSEDVFVFPFAMIHFQLNIGKTAAVAISSLSSQNPGVITIANAEFESKPPINSKVLTKAFQVDKKIIDYLQSQFWYNNHS